MNLKIKSSGYTGIDNYLVDIEMDIGNGIPSFYIIGLGDISVSESKERVRIALKSLDVTLSQKKILVNLSPASQKKEGAHYDLGIAIGLLIGLGEISDTQSILDNYLFLGELSLNGEVKGIKGAIGSAILAKELKYKGIIIPNENLEEVLLVPDIEIIGVGKLMDLKNLFLDYNNYINKNSEKVKNILELKKLKERGKNSIGENDFADVKGQQMAKRALEIAVAGGHNILMIGSPGSGKSMLARRVASIMPSMSIEETIECTKIYSIAGELSKENPFLLKRPFRAPHHTGTIASIIGGGRTLKPGEITLAHNGVLFLDELSEFNKDILESLRQPLEDRKVFISRIGYKIELPANFLLIGASNPCNCGYHNVINPTRNENYRCTCTAGEIAKYKRKLSGPLLDRIDLYIPISPLNKDELTKDQKEEGSLEIKKRINFVREVQYNRYKENKTNSLMTQKEIKKYCKLSQQCLEIIENVIEKLGISARSYDKILKVARTIADLENNKVIEKHHLFEAISYRKKEE